MAGRFGRFLEVVVREAKRKVYIGGSQRAYWGPSNIAHLAGVAIRVLAYGGPGAVMRKLRSVGERALARTDYASWAEDEAALEERRRPEILREAASLGWKPVVSILMVDREAPFASMRAAIDSIVAQVYPHWELCVVDDGSLNNDTRRVLDECAAGEPRIHVLHDHKNRSPFAAASSALAAARGEFVSLVGCDDLISPMALLELVRALNENPTLDMVYSDEDKIDAGGVRFEPFFKPDWSPDYLESCMYTTRLALYRKALVDQIGAFASELDGAQEYDLVLRLTERTDKIGHVPRVLNHRRATPGSIADPERHSGSRLPACTQALADHLARTGRRGTVNAAEHTGCYNVRWALPQEPRVSIIVPTAGGDRVVRGQTVNLVTRCVDRICTASTYKNFEIVIVDNGDLRPEVREALQRFDCRFITFAEPEFNISKKLNLGAMAARGEYLLLLNDDTEVITPDWMEAMLEQGLKPGVGVVGAKLLYEDGSIQHVGVTFHEGLPDHVRKHYPARDAGYYFSTVAVRNYLAVTGACMLTRAADFRDAGGYDEAYRDNYSDIDYCLKLRDRGLRTVYTPHAALYHYESVSRKFVGLQGEVDRFLARWKSLTLSDPYYNGEYLQTKPPDFSLNLRMRRL